MAETLISPGIQLRENDLSQITEAPIQAGAALIGPTVIGPVDIPTVVRSYSDYKSKFGGSFVSGGQNYEYLTSIAALNYFEQGGTSLLVTRVASGSYTAASASIDSNIGRPASSSLSLTSAVTAQYTLNINGDTFILSGSSAQDVYNRVSSSILLSEIADTSSSFANPNMILTAKTIGSIGNTYYYVGTGNKVYYQGGFASSSFTIETLSVGEIMNNYSASQSGSGIAISGSLISGSSANVRWEIAAASSASGQFTLLVRRGDDNEQNKTVLETWNNLSLDPNDSNYIAYVIGDQSETRLTDEFGNAYLQTSGSYGNKSRYIRVKSVDRPTPNYFTSTGTPDSAYTGSIPAIGYGGFYGAFTAASGKIWGAYKIAPLNMFESIPITPATTPDKNIQGVNVDHYANAITLLKNKEAYDFNIIYAPGVNNQNAPTVVSSLLELAENRGDCITVVDMVGYDQTMTTATTQASSYDNSYAATYFPWLRVRSRETGKINAVPASTLIPAIYEYNDKVSAEWFAPAGLTRGNLATVLRPERRLSLQERNFLYEGKVNPIADFSGIGTVLYGQKTLQSRATALDRVNVRRLMISLKRYIRNVAEDLIFEPNTQVTRNKFLNKINPYLEYIQQKQGLYAFQIIMDDSNNTSDVVDRNQLVGAIYLQPTRAVEFVYLDFNILPTGATFGA